MKEGFYEQIITQSLQKQLSALQAEVQQRIEICQGISKNLKMRIIINSGKVVPTPA